MNNVDIGIDFGITNSDVVIHSSNNVSYKSLRSEKNIHLSLKNIIKSIQEDSKIKSISVTGGKHLDLPDIFDGQKIIKKNEINSIGAGAKKLSQLDSNFLVLSDSFAISAKIRDFLPSSKLARGLEFFLQIFTKSSS